MMEPKFIQKSEILLAGMSFYGDPFETSAGWTDENHIGRLWQRLTAYLEENAEALSQRLPVNASYEVHIYGPETMTKGFFEVFVGISVANLATLPVELLAKVLPPTEYAVFSLYGAQISTDWHLEIDEWMAQSGYKNALPFSFQYYDERFKGLDRIEESVLDVYVPVKAKHGDS